jgi:hypothetical protein
MHHNCSLIVSCTSRRFQRRLIDGSEMHTAQSYAHTVDHTVPYNAYAYDRMIFFGNHTVCEDPNYELHLGGLVWFWGFASELELARWGAVHLARFLVA